MSYLQCSKLEGIQFINDTQEPFHAGINIQEAIFLSLQSICKML